MAAFSPFLYIRALLLRLSRGRFGRSFSNRSSLLFAFTSTSGFGLVGLSVDVEQVLIVIDEFDHGHFRSVAKTVLRHTDDSRVTTRAGSHFGADFTEQLGHGILVLQVAEDDAAVAAAFSPLPCRNR